MGIENRMQTPLAEAVRKAGGQSSFARLIKRNQSTVFDWLKLGKPLPAELCVVVERNTGVTRQALRPDLFSPDHDTGMPIGISNVASDSTLVSDGRAA